MWAYAPLKYFTMVLLLLLYIFLMFPKEKQNKLYLNKVFKEFLFFDGSFIH